MIFSPHHRVPAETESGNSVASSLKRWGLAFCLQTVPNLQGANLRFIFALWWCKRDAPSIENISNSEFRFFFPRLCSVMASPNARQFPRLPFIFEIYTLVYCVSLRDGASWVGHIKGLSTCDTFQVLLCYGDTEAKHLLTHSVAALVYQNTLPSFQWLPISSHLVMWGAGSAEWIDYKWGANSPWPAPHFLAQGSFLCANPQRLFF